MASSAIVWLVLALAALSGLLIGAAAWHAVVGLAAFVVAVLLTLVGLRSWPQRALRAVFVGGAMLMLVAAAVQHVFRLPLGYAMELLLFSLLLGAFLQARHHMPGDRALRWLLALLLVYLLCALFSTVLGRSKPVPALWQFQYNLKWPAMFMLGLLFVWDASHDRMLRRLLAIGWVPMVAMVALEWVLPSVHQLVFEPAHDAHANPLLGALRRFRGPFSHAGYLALISAVLAWCCAVYAVTDKQRRWWLPAIAYGTLLLLAGQRQEAAGLALALVGLVAWQWRRFAPLLLVAACFVLGAGLSMLVLGPALPVPDVLAQWGFGSPLHPLSERAILSAKGLEVASRHFPWGSGLGTYGGAGAQKFDQSLFLELGFGQFAWFRQGKFLVDVYWPSVIAETGWFGAAGLAACYLLMLVTLARRLLAARAVDGILLIGAGALLILLSNTPTSGVISDPRGSFVFWLLIGAAWRRSSLPSRPTAPRAGAPSGWRGVR